MKAKILVVDDEESFRFTMVEALKKEGYEVTTASNGKEALDLLKEEFYEVVTMDIRMPGMDGIETLTEMKKINPNVVVVMVTAHGGEEKIGVQAIQKGAYDYFTKPFDLEEFRLVIRRAIEKQHLDYENETLRQELIKRYRFENIIGNSGKMVEVFELISKVVNANVTVLVQGESGTGKELTAKAIHYNSPRKDKPFIKMNCVAIPDTLLESELFGYEKGAFTGAMNRKLGRFELANDGTLFLDEVGDMNLLTQAKLLRVLQEKEFERVGGTEPIKVDVRIIAATNKDLAKMVKEGNFREDLYYRLNVVLINLPPLRERREDLPVLVEHFINRFNKELKREIKHISVDAMELLMKYEWPGNIRELENIVQRAIVLEKGDTLTREHLPMAIRAVEPEVRVDLERLATNRSFFEAVREIVEDVEKQLILKALNKTGGNRTKAAADLMLDRKSLFNKMKKYGLYENDKGDCPRFTERSS
jgi:DNA-binding NtrC family response regulator